MIDICLIIATQRGYRCLETIASLLPEGRFAVFSFREEPYEPPFLDDIRRLTESLGGVFMEARNAGHPKFDSFWATTEISLMLSVSWRYMIPASVYRRARR